MGYLFLGLLLCAGGCGKKQREPLELDVFAGRANYQGEQKGWYAKIVQDKFNLKLNIIAPNVSGGGNLLFESRLTAGKVGDIVITSYQNMKECVEAGVLADLTPYLEKTTYLKQYLDVIKQMNVQNGYTDAIILFRLLCLPCRQRSLCCTATNRNLHLICHGVIIKNWIIR